MINLYEKFKYLNTQTIFDKHKMINVHCIK
jgi:hypothetical protein